ncbi:Alpha/Beta hydrolase protein [Umbelopsis sp. AD052]|nr:Alpha/Beta hydrolase protein [Umbelopsis sp. AD052]
MGYLHYLLIKLKFQLIRGISELFQLILIRSRLPGPQLKQAIPGSAPQYASFFFPPSYESNSGQRYPIYIHIHGGGFIGGWTCEDRQLCHYIAQNVNCVVISIAYRFAPEYPYPTGLHDCQAAVKWILQEYQPTKVAIGGLSAGGTLALEQNPLVRNMFHEAYLLNTKDTDEELRNPLLSVRYIPASQLPESVVIIAAEDDPNIKDMELFGKRVTQHRPLAIYKLYPGAIHGFMNIPDFLLPKKLKDQKWDAFNLMTNELKLVLVSS